jgi:TetR/AcrR family transcriptional regulator, transcriptional repressor for nem operon
MLMKKSAITRQMLLQNAFQLIYVKGYQSTSIDDIIATTHVTKGAFFHHFQNKE